MVYHIALSLLCLAPSPIVDSLKVNSVEQHISIIQQAITENVCTTAKDPGLTIPFESMKILGEKFERAGVSFTHNGMTIYAILPEKLAERIDQDLNGRRV